MPVYNKLVRDLIPTIIEKDGKACTVKQLDHAAYIVELKKKMHEELAEYEHAENDFEAIEELADLLELLYAATAVHGATVKELEEIRQQKAINRGKFDERLFLVEVEDD